MLSSSELNLGLIGQKLSHSFSKQYFLEKYGIATYSLIELTTLSELHSAISRLHLDGFNVTIPYKREIIPLLNDIDPIAKEIGAVNTVVVKRIHRQDSQSQNKTEQIRLIGYNTDAPAFLETLQSHIEPHHNKALILGTGGASLAVSWALRQQGIEYRFVSRTPHGTFISYDTARELLKNDDFSIIINATPVGMYPNCEASPWPFPELLNRHHLCYDLIYNPSPTLFLKEAESRGAKTLNGLAMLHLQADLALKIWNTSR